MRELPTEASSSQSKRRGCVLLAAAAVCCIVVSIIDQPKPNHSRSTLRTHIQRPQQQHAHTIASAHLSSGSSIPTSSLRRGGVASRVSAIRGLSSLLQKPASAGTASARSPSLPCFSSASSSVADVSGDVSVKDLKAKLFELLDKAPRRGNSLDDDQQQQLLSVIETLGGLSGGETMSFNESPLLPGQWKLRATFKPGPIVRFDDLDSWRNYLFGKGPSPVQSLVTGNTQQVDGIYQLLTLKRTSEQQQSLTRPAQQEGFENIVQFSDGAFLNITAFIVDMPSSSLIRFRFDEGNFLFTKNPLNQQPLDKPLTVPYPVPFKLLSLLGDETIGSLNTLYLDHEIRIAQGNKGSFFVFERVEEVPALKLLEEANKATTNPTHTTNSNNDQASSSAAAAPSQTKFPVVICPAQFAIPSDYDVLGKALESRGHEGVYPAALSRVQWLRILPSALTSDYWNGELKPQKALTFYYEAITEAYQKARREHPESKINFIGHSIGGWILRAWLRDTLSPEEQKHVVASVTTLGTPHNPPPEDSIWKSFDQTRGLLSFVNSQAPGAHLDGVKYTCVVGNATRGRVSSLSDSDDIESAVAFVSYLPLCGNGNVDGDGIVPIQNALLDDDNCRKIIIQGAKHSAFLPSPGPSIMLPEDWLWYGSEDCMDQWAGELL